MIICLQAWTDRGRCSSRANSYKTIDWCKQKVFKLELFKILFFKVRIILYERAEKTHLTCHSWFDTIKLSWIRFLFFNYCECKQQNIWEQQAGAVWVTATHTSQINRRRNKTFTGKRVFMETKRETCPENCYLTELTNTHTQKTHKHTLSPHTHTLTDSLSLTHILGFKVQTVPACTC